jgi:hypothetical protein
MHRLASLVLLLLLVKLSRYNLQPRSVAWG